VSKIVLCVDDSVTMQQVADITFRGTEFTYVGARNHDEGLDKARSQKPVVILADSVMPGQGKSGYDLCLALKSDPATAGVPVVILVGNGAPYDSTKGVQVGADANLPKPWDTQTMLEKIGEVVAKAASGVARPGQGASATPAATAAIPVAAAAAKSAPASPASVGSAASAAAMPPRSATIMGMPTIKMPAGVAAPVAPAVAASSQPVKASVMAVPPLSPAPAMTTPGTGANLRAPAGASTAAPVAPVASAPMSAFGASRAPMITGTPTKRSVLVERTLAKMAARLAEAAGVEPGSPELLALLKLSTEVVERIVWEVVPDLAEQIIRENLHELTQRRSS
jgi:CheY-like chemotaxis protein